jgi:hypothetical protein
MVAGSASIAFLYGPLGPLGYAKGFKDAAFAHCAARGYPSWYIDRHRQIRCLTSSGKDGTVEDWPGARPPEDEKRPEPSAKPEPPAPISPAKPPKAGKRQPTA